MDVIKVRYRNISGGDFMVSWRGEGRGRGEGKWCNYLSNQREVGGRGKTLSRNFGGEGHCHYPPNGSDII